MLYSPATKTILYPHVADPARIVEVLPEARRLNGAHVIVPHGMREMQVMRFMGYPALSPILTEYDWPSNPHKVPKPFDHQRQMAAFMTLHPRCFNLADMGCVDAETEYLSPIGWKRMDQYDGGKVAQYNLNGTAEFVQPTEYVKKPCPKMLHFKTTRGVDQMLSAEHRVLFVTRQKKTEVLSALCIAEMQDKLVMGWKGRFITTFKAPEQLGILWSENRLRLQVAVIADGHFPNKSHTCVMRLKKPRKKQRIRVLLKNAGIEWRETSRDTRTAKGFTVFSFKSPSRDKEFTVDYWACSPKQLAVVAEEVVHWDGAVCKADGSAFFSTSKASADFIQYAWSATGRTCTMAVDKRKGRVDCYTVYARAGAALVHLTGVDKHGKKTQPVSWADSTDGYKYCFVVPSTFLVFRRNGRVFMSGNTGKTLSVLWALDYLMHKGIVHKALILSPLSTIYRVWEYEIFNHFLSRRSVTVLYGDRERRIAAADKAADFYIINHDGLGIGSSKTPKGFTLGDLGRMVKERVDIDAVIVDEGSVYKDSATNRYKVLRQILADKPYVWWLTGTPTPVEPTNAWSQARIVRKDYVESYISLRERTMTRVSQFKWVPRKEGMAIAAQILQPAIRFERDECLDLPDVMIQTLDVELSAAQKKAYDDLKKTLKAQLATGTINAVNEAALRMKLIQIACGAVYGPDHEVHRVDCAPRLKVLEEVIEESSHKLLIFSSLTSVITLLYSELRKRYAIEKVTGEVSAKRRNEIFKSFQEEANPRILVADPGCMAHGLTLTAADTTIWFGPTDKPELYQQANKRMDRPGQKNSMLIVRLAATPVEREIYRRLDSREKMQGLILDMVKEG